jgi:hypothetical protein
MLDDQVGVEPAGQQRTRQGMGVHGRRAGSHPIQGDLAEIPDPRRELQTHQVEQPEIDQGHPMGVSGVLGDRQVALPKISSNTKWASRLVATMIFVP